MLTMCRNWSHPRRYLLGTAIVSTARVLGQGVEEDQLLSVVLYFGEHLVNFCQQCIPWE